MRGAEEAGWRSGQELGHRRLDRARPGQLPPQRLSGGEKLLLQIGLGPVRPLVS